MVNALIFVPVVSFMQSALLPSLILTIAFVAKVHLRYGPLPLTLDCIALWKIAIFSKRVVEAFPK